MSDDRCVVCKATFRSGSLKDGVCTACINEHGGPVDIEKLLRENNPELFPTPEYATKEEVAEFITKDEAKKMISDAVKMAMARVAKGDK